MNPDFFGIYLHIQMQIDKEEIVMEIYVKLRNVPYDSCVLNFQYNYYL